MVFIKLNMANLDQKTILIEQAVEDIIVICKQFQDDSGSSNFEVKTLLNDIASLWDKEKKKIRFSIIIRFTQKVFIVNNTKNLINKN